MFVWVSVWTACILHQQFHRLIICDYMLSFSHFVLCFYVLIICTASSHCVSIYCNFFQIKHQYYYKASQWLAWEWVCGWYAFHLNLVRCFLCVSIEMVWVFKWLKQTMGTTKKRLFAYLKKIYAILWQFSKVIIYLKKFNCLQLLLLCLCFFDIELTNSQTHSTVVTTTQSKFYTNIRILKINSICIFIL